MNAYYKVIMLAIGLGLFGFGASAVNGHDDKAVTGGSDVDLADGASNGIVVFRGVYDEDYCLGYTDYLEQCDAFYPSTYFIEGGRFFGRGFRGNRGHRDGRGGHMHSGQHSSGQHRSHQRP